MEKLVVMCGVMESVKGNAQRIYEHSLAITFNRNGWKCLNVIDNCSVVIK